MFSPFAYVTEIGSLATFSITGGIDFYADWEEGWKCGTLSFSLSFLLYQFLFSFVVIFNYCPFIPVTKNFRLPTKGTA